MSREDVSELLGPGAEVTDPNTIRSVSKLIQTGVSYPDGVGAIDVFVEYPTAWGGTYLQFRHNKLVNFDPGEYTEVRPPLLAGR
jgi:hypothetical protein